MTVIKLAKTPPSAFNPRRPASALLLSQIEHLEHAVGREPRRVKRSEGQAAKYIAQLTAELMAQSQQPTAPAPAPLSGTSPAMASASPATVTTTTVTKHDIPVGMKKVGTKKHLMPIRKARSRPAAKAKARPAAGKKATAKKKAARRRTR